MSNVIAQMVANNHRVSSDSVELTKVRPSELSYVNNSRNDLMYQGEIFNNEKRTSYKDAKVMYCADEQGKHCSGIFARYIVTVKG